MGLICIASFLLFWCANHVFVWSVVCDIGFWILFIKRQSVDKVSAARLVVSSVELDREVGVVEVFGGGVGCHVVAFPEDELSPPSHA